MTSTLGGATASVHPWGAPLGNQNARQHGLYSQKAPLPPAEQIVALRAAASAHSWSVTANLIAKTASLRSPRDIARTLRRLTLAYNALNRLVRAQLFAPAAVPVPYGRSIRGECFAPLQPLPHPTSWSARFPFVHPIVFNLTQLLFHPIRLRAQSP